MTKTISIETDFITLGQFLKWTECVPTGGMVKRFLQEQAVYINGEPETRRGRKLYPGDFVRVPGAGSFIIQAEKES
jgi:S4 domain protein YaaA